MMFTRLGSIFILLIYVTIFSQTSVNDPLEELEIILDASEPISADGSAAIDTSGQITQMPQLIEFIKADYPADLIKKGISGTVVLEILINETGGVDSASIVKGIHPVLDTNALKAVLKFKFTPALDGKDSVAVLLQYEYHFTLDESVDSVPKVSNFHGVLLEKGTRQPVGDAMVVVTFPDSVDDPSLPLPFEKYLQKIASFDGQHLEENQLVATTDSLGRFSFFSLPSCTVRVQVIISGYTSYKTKEFIKSGEELEAKYYIARMSYSDYEIVVYGKAEEKEVSRRQLSIQEIKKIPGLGGDAVKVVQAMPGVARPSMMSGAVVVRGAPTWDSKFYLDGVEIPLLYHYGGLKSTYSSEALEGIEFYPGGFGTRYGGGIAGAIELKGKEAAKDRWHGTLDMGDIDASFFIEGPVSKKVSILASARRSFIGEIAEFVTTKFSDYFPFTLSTFYWDYVLRTDINFTKNSHLFVTLFGTRDSMAIIAPDFDEGSDEISAAQDKMGMNITSHLGLVGWDLKINDKLTNTARYSLSSAHSALTPFGFFKSESDGLIQSLRDQLSYKKSDKLTLNVGLDIDLSVWDVDLTIIDGMNTIDRSEINDWWFSRAGAYFNLEWKLTPKLLLIPGLRYDYYHELKHDGTIVPAFWNYEEFDNSRGISGDPSFRLIGRYQLNDAHTIKAAVGNYNQTPQPLGQAIHPTWGNPSISTTKAAHYVAGHEWKITDVINSDIQIYFNNQWNIPEFPDGTDNNSSGEIQTLCYDRGRGRMYGMELMLRHLQTDRFFGWIAYTLSKTERYDYTKKRWLRYEQDETHHLQILGSWHLRRQWDAGFRLRYVTGKPVTPIIGVQYVEKYARYEPVYGEENSSRRNPAFQLDIRIDKKIVYNKWIYSLYFDLQNISYLFYKTPEFEAYDYKYDDKTTISMFPMLGVGLKAEF